MRRFVLALTLAALVGVLVAPAADAGFRPDHRRGAPHPSARECYVINNLEGIYATDPARVDRGVRDRVMHAYQRDDLDDYWATVSQCADANLTPIVQGWILYYDPSFVF